MQDAGSKKTPDASLMERSLIALRQQRKRVEELEGERHAPVAIVGMSCRFPGADDLAGYWSLLTEGRSAISEVGPDRWSREDRGRSSGTDTGRYAGLLTDLEGFDAEFFNISPREAMSMDPQQRWVLEEAWHALEDAGIAPDSLQGSLSGVFVGATARDYAARLQQCQADTPIDAFYVSGNALNFIAGRLAYQLGLRGPSLAIDTACSSALTAVHLAIQSLRRGECELAIAAGVNIVMAREVSEASARSNLLAADGRCKTFDASADGIVRGEGCGVVVLMPLSKAVDEGRPVLAVLRGSAINQDGASSGLMTPNLAAQVDVLNAALADARVSATEIDYVEAHGTGTALGDPIELRALGRVFGDRTDTVLVGSVKTNIGHLESAAGMAGLIKVVMSMRAGVIPPHLHMTEPTPHADWSRLPLRVPVEATSWPRQGRPFLAGISAFGGSGSNAHVVVEQAPSASDAEATGPWLLPLSAHSAAALRALKQRWAQALRQEESSGRQRLLCARARTGRALLDHRFAVAGQSLAEVLQALSAGADTRALSTKPVVAFLFSGQGSQYVGMGRNLYAAEPAFRNALDALADDFFEETGASITQVLWDEHGSWLEQAKYAQPALFALQIALVQAWASFGVCPDVLLGHSIGEIAAACAAGAFDARTGLRLAAVRGRLMHENCTPGGMVAIAAEAAEIEQRLPSYPGLTVAARNAQRQTVVAGNIPMILALTEKLQQEGVRAQRLQVSHAFHSALMTPMLRKFAEACGGLALGAPSLDLISSRTGALEREQLADPSHWVDHVREPVAFIEALATLSAEQPTVLVEIGPGRTLLGLARLAGIEASAVASLLPSREETGFLDAQAQLYCSGVNVRWPRIGGEHVDAPLYPFQHQRFMVDVGFDRAAPAADLLDWQWQDSKLPSGTDLRPLLLAESDGTTHDVGLPANLLNRADRTDNRKVSTGALVDLRFMGLRRICPADAVAEFARSYRAWADSCPQEAYWLCLDEHAEDAQSAMVKAALVGFALSMVWRGGSPVGVLQMAGALDPADPQLQQLFSCDAKAVAREPWWRSDGRQWKVARLESRTLQGGGLVPMRVGRETTTLITGGFGDLGLALIERLATRNAGQIVVLSRRPESSLDAGSQQRIAALRHHGARIRSYVVDVARRDDLQNVLNALDAEGLALSDIYHLAGSLAASTLEQAGIPEVVSEYLRAKQVGAYLLHELTSSRTGVRLILVGSAAGSWGSGDHALYAAANAAVAGLAEWRLAHGMATVHVASGPIAGTAMAQGADGDRVESAGLRRMAAANVLDAIEQLCTHSRASAIVAQADWPRFSAACSSKAGVAWFDALAKTRAGAAAGVGNASSSGPDILAQQGLPLASLSLDARRQSLRQLTAEVASTALGIHSDAFDAEAPLLNAGVDSVIALEIAQRISQRLQLPLPGTLVFEHGSARAIADYLLSAIGPVEEVKGARAPGPRTAATEEPIAIIGASARMPGGADDIHGFWRNLLDAVDGIIDEPRERFDVDAWLGQDSDERPYTLAMGALSEIECFDAALFGIGPREAGLMDPQQRLVLQGVWHALEHAGIDPLSLRGHKGGVFLGVADCEYLPVLRDHMQLAPDLAYLGTSTKTNVIAGRVSYTFGWEGPSVALDTACSSAATAIHLACSSLRSGESEFALAGGVNLILDPQTFASPCKANMLARDGRCKSFDQRADGYVRSEGCGLVVLKRLSDARRNGDNVLATIVGSAINQDGRSSSLTAPNPIAQKRVIQDALAVAGIDADAVDVVEAHGTGTPLGDPIEWSALSAVFDHPSRRRPLWLGSAKSLIGHTEAAAGAAGLIKLALSLHHGKITDNRHFGMLNAEIPRVETSSIRVAHDGDPERREPPRIGGISSFGFSGTNVHLVLEAAAPPAKCAASTLPLLCIGAATAAALASACEHWARTLESVTGDVDEYLALCAASRWGRWHGPHRLAVAATDATEALAAMREALSDREQGLTGQGYPRAVVQVDLLTLTDADDVLRQLGEPLADDPDERVFMGTVAFARKLVNNGVVVDQWRAGDAPVLALAAIAGSFDSADAWKAIRNKAVPRAPRAPGLPCTDGSGQSLDHHFADPAFWDGRADLVVEKAQRGSSSTISLCALVPDRKDSARASFETRALARAYAAGLDVRWSDLGVRRSAFAPLTSFSKDRFWPHAGTPLVQSRPTRPAPDGHYLLGTRHSLPRSSELRFRRTFTSVSPAYVDDHRLLSTVVVPAASHLSMVLSAWRASGGSWPCTVEDIRLLTPLVLHDHGARTVELILARRPDGFDVELISCDGVAVADDAGWTTHMRCHLRGGASDEAAPVAPGEVIREWAPTISRDSFYAQFWEHGYTLGESFRWLGAGWVRDGETVREVFRPTTPEPLDLFELHPGLIDTCFSVLSSGQLAWTGSRDDERIFIPVSIEKVEFFGWASDHGDSWMHARACSQPVAPGARAREDICLFEAHGRVVARILGFETRQAQRDALRLGYRESVRDQLYRLDWQPFEEETRRPAVPAERVALVDAGCALADALSDDLHRQRLLGARARWPDDQVGLPEPALEAWAAAVVEKLRCDRSETLVLLPADHDRSEARLALLRAMVVLWRSLQRMDEALRPAVVLITRGGALLPGRAPQPLHSALWGFARGLQAEHGERSIRIGDLASEESTEQQLMGVFHMLTGKASASQSAWWQGQGWEPRLQRHKLSRSHGDLPVRRDARYVISGGLGGIGQALTRWLIERGAPLVQLLVRRVDPTAVAELEAFAAVHDSRIDIVVSPHGSVDALSRHALPLAGIFHAAGSTQDALVTQAPLESVSSILAGKWTVGEALASLALRERPDVVVMFGSLAATLPGQGQAIYAAANAALEAITAGLRMQGIHAVTIGFGPWSEAGMASRLGAGYHKRLLAMGMQPFSPQQGLHVLSQVAQEPQAALIAASVQWSTFLAARREYAASNMLMAFRGGTLADASAAGGQLRRALTALPPVQREGALELALKAAIAKVLGLSGPSQVGRQRRLFDLGLDSMAAMDLRELLQAELEMKLRATVLFDYPNVEALCRYLLTELFGASTADSVQRGDAYMEIDALSEADAEALLLAELKE